MGTKLTANTGTFIIRIDWGSAWTSVCSEAQCVGAWKQVNKVPPEEGTKSQIADHMTAQ